MTDVLTPAAEDYVIIPSAPAWMFELDESSLPPTKKRARFSQKARDQVNILRSKIPGVKGARKQGVPLQELPQK